MLTPAATSAAGFTKLSDPAAVDAAIAQAGRDHRPVIVDVFADWCVSCVEMERKVLVLPATQTLLAPIPAERDVYKLNAGRAGRIYAEGQDQWVSAWIINTATGATVGTNNSLFIREGDGEVDPTGRYYYHCDNNSSGAVLTKYDVSEDKWTSLKSSVTGICRVMSRRHRAAGSVTARRAASGWLGIRRHRLTFQCYCKVELYRRRRKWRR